MRITKIYIIKKKPYKIPQNLKNDQNTIGTAKMTKMHHKCPKYPKHLKMTKMFPKSPKWPQYPPTTFKRPKYPLLENLVLHLIQNTQRKQQSWIYNLN